MFFQQLSFYLFMEFYGQKLENDVPSLTLWNG